MIRKVFVSLICFISIISITACSFQPNNGDTIRLAEVTRSIFYAPLYVAIEKGFFEEEDLHIELTTTWGGDKTMTSLLSGGSDIALVGAETSIYVNAQEPAEPIINFAMLTQSDGTFLMARNNTADEFAWEDLKGSTFLGQRKGGMPQMTGEFVLKQNHIDPHQDLTLIQNIDFANIANAYASGTGEYVQLFEPQATMFEHQGLGSIVASFGEESGAVPYTVFMTKEGYMEENEDHIERFTRAIYKAQTWIYNASAEEVATAVAPYFDDTSTDIIADSFVRYRNQQSYAQTPVLTEEAWNNLQDIMDEAGELPERSDYNTYVNNTWAEKVINE
ncbi:NitT/TauT family transport system substrate-binding protein [Alteribacillus persepolensis]|uniref:NitT/TauT family transport system substrate-binding protein n=1 Tax=Alteribacillus persepolensis TaxID=568899 RepID=A0A1G8E2Y6_9BACI|nr:ABC transporter substrate-binding protein [Alteribacillus persepolensis]SDH64009.1 NitT/TauT family transport system substrate-binding protein [Alteribacillus persepolensis]